MLLNHAHFGGEPPMKIGRAAEPPIQINNGQMSCSVFVQRAIPSNKLEEVCLGKRSHWAVLADERREIAFARRQKTLSELIEIAAQYHIIATHNIVARQCCSCEARRRNECRQWTRWSHRKLSVGRYGCTGTLCQCRQRATERFGKLAAGATG